jgi:hypothetical protein
MLLRIKIQKQFIKDSSLTEPGSSGLRLEECEYVLPVHGCKKSDSGWIYYSVIAYNPLGVNAGVGLGRVHIHIRPHSNTATLWWNDDNTGEDEEFAVVNNVEVEVVDEYPLLAK